MHPLHIKKTTLAAQPTRHGDHILKKVFLQAGILPCVTQVAVAEVPPNCETEFHVHPTMFEVYFVLHGSADYDVAGQTYTVAPGDLLVVPPGAQHRQRTKSAPHSIFYWGIATE